MTPPVQCFEVAGISPGRRVLEACLAVALLLVGWRLAVGTPNLNFGGPCVFHALTGHSCLTCGMTRSLHALAHGEIAASFRYHLMGPLVFLGMTLAFFVFLAEAIRGRSVALPFNRKAWTRMAMLAAAVWFLYWIGRVALELRAAEAGCL